jgi:TRAP-type C4-dicarboxylate transport system permease small subunit
MNVQAHRVTDAAAMPASERRDPLRIVDRIAEAVVVVALLVELCLVLANVLARVYLHHSFLWADEAARLALSILAFIGGAVAYRRRDHAFVSLVLNLLPRPVGQGFLAFADILVVFVVAVTGIASAEFLASSWGELTPILQLPAALIAAPLPVAWR